MTCSQCIGIEREFNDKVAARDLRRFRRRGPLRSTRLLVDAIGRAGVEGATVLDIGGGVGAVSHTLLAAGAGHATDVDGASAYLGAARAEAERRGHRERMTFLHGDFVALAPSIPPADIVTLDRVVCCYDNMPALVGLSAAKARRLYGLVYPRDTWWVKAAVRLANLYFRLRACPFRTFVYPTELVDAAVRAKGLVPISHRYWGPWQVVLYRRYGE